MSRILAFDYGRRRIGLAISDPTRTIASPLTTLTRREGKRPPWAEIRRVVEEREVEEFVVGLPLDLAGEEGEWAREVRAFGAQLASRFGRPVHWVDERLTSVSAERVVRGLGLNRGEREQKERVDAAAAAIILQLFLKRGPDALDAEPVRALLGGGRVVGGVRRDDQVRCDRSRGRRLRREHVERRAREPAATQGGQ